jgi:GTPase SAR1 family protein
MHSEFSGQKLKSVKLYAVLTINFAIIFASNLKSVFLRIRTHAGLDHIAYKEALDDAIELTLKYLKFLFIGPPRSGKSTFRRRLMKEIVNLHSLGQSSDSTGVSEGDEITIMTPKKIVSEHAAIAFAEHTEAAEGSQVAHESQWKSMKVVKGGSNNAGEQSKLYDKSVHSLTHLFFKLISTCNKNSPGTQAKNEDIVSSVVEQESKENVSSSDENAEDESETLQKPQKDQDIEEAFNQLTTILQSDSPEKLEELLKSLELIMVNMMDIGGQPALLEMLPPLTIGPALYLLFFRLDQELNKSYEVKFRAPGSERDIPIPGHYCIKGVIHQSLSSIACFGCYSQEEKMSSKILLFGTYKDEAKRKGVDVSLIETELREELEETKFSTEGLLLDASYTDLFFSIDNMYGDEKEISKVRTSIETIVKDHFVPIKVPVVWLMLRVVLHLMNKPIVTLSQCKQIYERLSNQVKESSVEESSESVKRALRFFHHNVGNLMYYDKIPSMRDTVICDPQVVMDSVSSLIFDRFTGVNLSHDLDGFKKGQFTLDQIADATKEKRSKHLDVHQLIDLLKDRKILAEIEEISDEGEQGSQQADEKASKQADEQRRKQANERGSKQAHETATNLKQADEQGRMQANQPNRTFIMPAVLNIANLDCLKDASDKKRVYHEVPIMIHFSCGFVPFGVFSACMAYFIEPRNKTSLQWELSRDKMYRNKVTFRVNEKEDIGTKFFITFISRPHLFEIQISVLKTNRKEFQCICPSVRQDVFSALKILTSNWKYVPYSMSEKPLVSGPLFHLAFRCTLEDSDTEHLMILDKSEDTDGELTCTCVNGNGAPTLEKDHLVWFDKVSR